MEGHRKWERDKANDLPLPGRPLMTGGHGVTFRCSVTNITTPHSSAEDLVCQLCVDSHGALWPMALHPSAVALQHTASCCDPEHNVIFVGLSKLYCCYCCESHCKSLCFPVSVGDPCEGAQPTGCDLPFREHPHWTCCRERGWAARFSSESPDPQCSRGSPCLWSLRQQSSCRLDQG